MMNHRELQCRLVENQDNHCFHIICSHKLKMGVFESCMSTTYNFFYLCKYYNYNKKFHPTNSFEGHLLGSSWLCIYYVLKLDEHGRVAQVCCVSYAWRWCSRDNLLKDQGSISWFLSCPHFSRQVTVTLLFQPLVQMQAHLLHQLDTASRH